MPGKLNSSSFHSQFVAPWTVYRTVEGNDNPAGPALVAQTLDLTRMPSATAMQVWVTPEQVTGAAGQLDLLLVRANVGSLADVIPFATVDQAIAAQSLSEYRFTRLMPAVYRVLAVNLTPATTWRLHVTYTSSLSVDLNPVQASGAAEGGAGNYAGSAPNFTPSSGFGLAVDTSNNRIWYYFNSTWH